MAAEHARGRSRHLLHDRLVPPRRSGDELLQALAIARLHILAQPPDIFAPRGAGQPAQIMPRVPAGIPAVDDEVFCVVATKVHEASRRPAQPGGVIFCFGAPVSAPRHSVWLV